MEVTKRIKQKLKEETRKSKKLVKALHLYKPKVLNYVMGLLVKKRRSKAPFLRDVKAYLIKETVCPKIYDEKIMKNSQPFLKGTITSNPQNDYSQHFVDTGKRPQNFIKHTSYEDRYRSYPKLNDLIKLKDSFALSRSLPPLRFDLGLLKSQFDVILIEPPLMDYIDSHPCIGKKYDLWTWNDIVSLDIESIVSPRSFLFLWCGNGVGLEEGRKCFREWGFRRCEDLCWIKTNIDNKNALNVKNDSSVLIRMKEHLLMGIRGSIRRSSDIEFIHANIDLDVMVSEENYSGDIKKPEEIFSIIEHFCMGRRRLHIFGHESNVRPGWVTIGPNVLSSNYDPDFYLKVTEGENAYMGTLSEIESLRPKSPSIKPIINHPLAGL